MKSATSFLFAITSLAGVDAFQNIPPLTSTSRDSVTAINASSRRVFLTSSAVLGFTAFADKAFAADETVDSMIDELVASKKNLESVPGLLQAQEWEKVRAILKSPPVNNLWNLSDGKNTLLKVSKATGEFELIDLKDELSISLQICDQLAYDNVFVYYQPGNGKVKIKEPTDLAVKAIAQLGEAIDMAKAAAK